ncbi:MAG: NAD(P)/FAD-dependent oxidoreductase [Thermoanaerobaculia bacterium]
MKRVAIIGTGIAGLGCGYLLHRDFDVSLFDRNGYAGGHTNTVTVDEAGTPVPIDTGFMVFNEITYPNLTRLFASLGVQTVPTTMSFGVQHLPSGIEYAGGSVGQLFARRRNLISAPFLRALYQIGRFNREAQAALDSGSFERTTLQEYVDARGYGEDFLRLYLLPMSSAVWSTPFDEVRAFPAMTLLRFFRNHGLLGGLSGQHQWLTVKGGAKTYVETMTREFRDRIHLGNGVVRVDRDPSGATLRLADGSSRRFDKVVFACHADEALAMLAEPTTDERRLLGPFRYQRNLATLHTDPAPMPRRCRAWASWNYRIGEGSPGDAGTSTSATTIYWMNSLQKVSDRRDYFVSIDDPGLIDPARVLKTIPYHHPLFTMAAIDAQRELPSLNQLGPDQTTYFCGSYFRHGFHEDAFTSAIDASHALIRGATASEAAA